MDAIKSNWIRSNPRPRNQKFICPHCGKVSFCCAPIGEAGSRYNICDYAYCPRCGMLVDSNRKETT